MTDKDKNWLRLSDRILYSLELALDQEDLQISETLNSALEMSMTRNAGGGEFIERRHYPEAMEDSLERLQKLRDRNK